MNLFDSIWIFRLIDDQGKFYDDLLNEQQDLNNHIPIHLARLQQLEKQVSLINEKKDEKLNEIIKFIQEKILILFDEDFIFKFFGQKNSSSNDKDIQIIKTYLFEIKIKHKKFSSRSFSDMEKRRNWLIDIYVSLGNALCDLSILNDEQTLYLTNIIKILQKHIDINDGKLTNFIYKYYLNRKYYGRAWKLILKQMEEKSSSQQQEFDQKLLQVNRIVCFFSMEKKFSFLALSNNEYETLSCISRTFNDCEISSNLCPFLDLAQFILINFE